VRGLAIFAVLFGLIGIHEALRWATTESDRTFNFLMGVIFILFGVLFWELSNLFT
jgi:threonine/homoserine/homoserine lactone efflux protein